MNKKIIIVLFLIFFPICAFSQDINSCQKQNINENSDHETDIEDVITCDPDNPEEIASNDSVIFNVIKGRQLFTWSISGEDYWLDGEHKITQIVTTSRSVRIYTGSKPSCSAMILVIDSDNKKAKCGLQLKTDFEKYSFPENMQRGTSVQFSVSGGIPPYTWNVSGSGFRFFESITIGTVNSLHADQSACAGTIAVADSCGTLLEGSIRTPGRWVKIEPWCAIPGEPTETRWPMTVIRVEGKYKQTQGYDIIGAGGTNGNCEEKPPCPAQTVTAADCEACNNEFACTECIKWHRRNGEFPIFYEETGCGCFTEVACSRGLGLEEWICPE